jgi:hypothetical protein
VNSKPGYPSLNGNDQPVPQIYKRGWPDTKPHDEAIAETIAEVQELYPEQTIVGEPEIIATEEHKENGEYLVKVLSV